MGPESTNGGNGGTSKVFSKNSDKYLVKLGNRCYRPGEDVLDYTAEVYSLVKKAYEEIGLEAMAVSHILRGLPKDAYKRHVRLLNRPLAEVEKALCEDTALKDCAPFSSSAQAQPNPRWHHQQRRGFQAPRFGRSGGSAVTKPRDGPGLAPRNGPTGEQEDQDKDI
uniref:Protein kinase domain-containing protein n=1 Tax=Mesocestoides corti TaxID=53468 RepID=A0A5K3G0C9_MESCO